MLKTFTENEIVEHFDEIKPLFDKYNYDHKEDENDFWRFLCNKNVYILILDDAAFAVYEMVVNHKTKQLHCNIWQMFAPTRGKELAKIVREEAIAKGASVLGFWTMEPDKFKRLCKRNGVDFGPHVSYFTMGLNNKKESGICPQ